MSKCRVTKKNTTCGVNASQANTPTKNACKPFSACLSFGRTLAWDGNCFNVTGTPAIEDGWYGQVQVVNGCIVDAREAPLSVYTPAPCAPTAGDCSGGGSGGSGTINLSPDACNLLESSSGLLSAKLYLGDSSGITITGCGTRNSPLQFTVSAEASSIFVKSGTPQAIEVSGDGSAASPFTIGMTTTALGAGTYGAFEIDDYGRVTGFDEEGQGTISGVTNGNGVNLKVSGGVLRADLAEVLNVEGKYVTGGYTYTIDNTGRVFALRRDITIEGGEYIFGNYRVTLNDYGSVSKIEPLNEDNSAIPDTFVGTFKGNSQSTDTEREMSFETAFDGPMHVEYRGLLGRTSLEPGMTASLPSGFSISVDGNALADPLIEVAGVFSSDGVGANAIVAIRATSMNAIAAGSHTVTVTCPNVVITQRDGFMRAQIVGRGA